MQSGGLTGSTQRRSMVMVLILMAAFVLGASNPKGDNLTYTWMISDGACGTFSSSGNQAV